MHFFLVLIFGILGASFALIVEILVLSLGSLNSPDAAAVQFSSLLTLLTVALVEESTKYVFLRRFAINYLQSGSISLSRALLYGLFFGLGFASVESMLILQTGSPFPPLWPLLGTFFLHIFTALAFALFLLRDVNKRALALCLVLPVLIALHLIYNLLVLRLS